MLTIHKYELSHYEKPKWHYGGKILSVQYQDNKLMAWVLVDTDQFISQQELEIVGTGWELPAIICDDWELPYYAESGYIASVQEGNFVWHIFNWRQR